MLSKLSILILLVFCIFLFFWKLDSVPPGFYIDESMHSYNALSILETGKDEYGKSYPVLFRFYGSYNEPLYIYLTSVSIYLFGDNIFGARFISALAGISSVFLFYFFIYVITKNKITSFFFALFAATNPWLLFYSRIGYEVATGFFLFFLGVFCFYLSFNKPKLIFLAYIIFSLSTYAAYTERFVSPLLAIVLTLIFKKHLSGKFNRKYFLLGIAGAAIIQLPHLVMLFTPAFFQKGDLFSAGLPLLVFIREFFSQYINYFSPEALFFKPDPDMQRSLPEISVFHLWMVVPYFIGWYFVFKNRSSKLSKILITSALITPIPAALTHDPFATHRAMPLLGPQLLIIGIGINKTFEFLKPKFGWLILLLLFFLSGLFLWRSYFVLFPGERSYYWGEQYVELSKIIIQKPETHFVIDQGRLKTAYATIAYFTKIDPVIFQKSTGDTIKNNYYSALPYNHNYYFANVELRPLNWESDIYKDQILVGDTLSISQGQVEEHFLKKEFEIQDPLGETLLQGFRTNPKLKCKIQYTNTDCEN
ncbi:hypothetical protein A2961_03515 [Candidatus Woesebacteria bacterium RIFCSPLOWO2_01_FULL_39_21]|uniref:Glycosyltransferase RgtA/B/C/D-like domain-containing protein n=1 Tax=Candidatus Woesebacteria bacterium RIFCSPLOWO2_01_FULL_39_21 TaxID=1802519 RepID=A0A1F8BEC5_9BACT|nr:MAG: hypothetical protein A2691_00550 [Candidatus Woesebacteria bacterium RIFCSPHIGHO2_01_FULL_39_23]OGM62411.1 MAG: hypothetical protein A2961_03515 [Candidatus Woesebacteria bacterium RIFCSPLOWO2_01_FULL_39_21]